MMDNGEKEYIKKSEELVGAALAAIYADHIHEDTIPTRTSPGPVTAKELDKLAKDGESASREHNYPQSTAPAKVSPFKKIVAWIMSAITAFGGGAATAKGIEEAKVKNDIQTVNEFKEEILNTSPRSETEEQREQKREFLEKLGEAIKAYRLYQSTNRNFRLSQSGYRNALETIYNSIDQYVAYIREEVIEEISKATGASPENVKIIYSQDSYDHDVYALVNGIRVEFRGHQLNSLGLASDICAKTQEIDSHGAIEYVHVDDIPTKDLESVAKAFMDSVRTFNKNHIENDQEIDYTEGNVLINGSVRIVDAEDGEKDDAIG